MVSPIQIHRILLHVLPQRKELLAEVFSSAFVYCVDYQLLCDWSRLDLRRIYVACTCIDLIDKLVVHQSTS